MIRKSDLDDYRGERFERAILGISTIVMHLQMSELENEPTIFNQHHQDANEKENVKLPKDLENKLLHVCLILVC